MAYDEGLRSVTEHADASIAFRTGPAGFMGNNQPLSAPADVAIAVQGATGSGHNAYRVSALSNTGETLAGAEVTVSNGNATLSGTNFNRVSWSPVAGAVSYNVYGRTAGGAKLLANVTGTSYDDKGSDTPNGDLPAVNNSSNYAGRQFRFVKYTGAETVGLATGATNEIPAGILQNKPQHVGAASTVGIRGKSVVMCGEAFQGGEPVRVGADGTARVGVLGTHFIVGVMVSAGARGVLGTVNLMPIGK